MFLERHLTTKIFITKGKLLPSSWTEKDLFNGIHKQLCPWKNFLKSQIWLSESFIQETNFHRHYHHCDFHIFSD